MQLYSVWVAMWPSAVKEALVQDWPPKGGIKDESRMMIDRTR